MPTSLHREDQSRSPRSTGARSQDVIWLVALVALPATVVGLALYLPPVLILPAVAGIALTAGFVLEAARYIFRALNGVPHLRDYAAGLVFAGLAASILADADAALMALSELKSEGPATRGDSR